MSPVLIGAAAPRPAPPPPPRRPAAPRPAPSAAAGAALGPAGAAPRAAGAPPPRPPAAGGAQFRHPALEPGAFNLIPMGSSFDTMYIVPLLGLTAELPQLAPPLLPGIWIVPRMLGGVNNPSFRDSRRSSRMQLRSSSGRYGLMSFSVKD